MVVYTLLLRVLTTRLRGDDKPFTIVTPAQAGVQNYCKRENSL